MLKSYFITAFRNAIRHKGYSFINIAGLSLGIAGCMLILVYVLTELSFDRYHTNANNIYRVGIDANIGGQDAKLPISNAPLMPVLLKDYPEVINAVRIRKTSRMPVKIGDKNFYEENIAYADASMFAVFTHPMIYGDPETALKEAHSVVLTETMARKYFPNPLHEKGYANPVGQTIKFNNGDDFQVTGVIEDVPDNSHFTFDFLLSFQTLYTRNPQHLENWMSFNYYTYLHLSEDTDYLVFQGKMAQVVQTYLSPTLNAIGGRIDYFLQPLTDIHLHSNLENEMAANSDIAYIYIFSAVAIFILLLACINFMNLATARSAQRAREVGMRKVLGARRRRLIFQFLGESIIYSLTALAIALIVVPLVLPFFSDIAGRQLQLDFAARPWLLPAFFALALLVGILGGSYPALFLSAFRPIKVLKGHLKTGNSGLRFRRILVVSQFVISVTMMIGALIIYSQLDYLKNKRLGFHKEQVVTIPLMDDSLVGDLTTIKTELARVPGVISSAAASKAPGENMDVNIYLPEGFSESESQIMQRINFDADFVPTLDIEIVEGRNFSREFATDPESAILINETAAKRFGWENPVGKYIRESDDSDARQWTVVGVLQDFHTESLHSVIQPLIVTNSSGYINDLLVRIRPDNIESTIAGLKKSWQGIDPNRPFEFTFLDQSFDSQYRAEEQFTTVFNYFTLFAIFVACLGLFGMASYAAEQRTKEIGIRKVLGAGAPGIVFLLSKEMIYLLLVANAIAWPLAYFLMETWLQDFAYRVDIGWLPFLAATILMFAVGFFTVSFQSIRAALMNPINALKYE